MQKPAYERRINGWSSDVCSSDLSTVDLEQLPMAFRNAAWPLADLLRASDERREAVCRALLDAGRVVDPVVAGLRRSEERGVGKGCASQCRSRCPPYHNKKNNKINIRSYLMLHTLGHEHKV